MTTRNGKTECGNKAQYRNFTVQYKKKRQKETGYHYFDYL